MMDTLMECAKSGEMHRQSIAIEINRQSTAIVVALSWQWHDNTTTIAVYKQFNEVLDAN